MQQVISELERLRRRGRVMLVVQRAAVMAAWTLGVLAAVILFDFALRLPSAFRLVLLLGGLIGLAYGVWAYFRLALVFRPSLTQLALRVEQVMPAVAGRLASSVEFAAGGIDQTNALAARSVHDTERRLAGESVGAVMKSGRMWRDVGIFAAVAAIVGAMTLTNPTAAATGVKRIFLPYSATKWPARTGVQSMMDRVLDGAAVHPRGQALPLRAQVTKGALDQDVSAYYRLRVDGEDQPWQRIVLTHQGGGIHERLIDTSEGAQRIEVYFATADDQTDIERIELVPPPAVRRASLTIEPPAYAAGHVLPLQTELGQGIDDRAVTDVPSLIGSAVTLRLELNKPLPTPTGDEQAVASWLKTTFGWSEAEALPSFALDPNDPSVWVLQWRLDATRTLALRLVDEHGLENIDPIAYRIDAVEDYPPSVTITQPQADEAVLASAVVPLECQARDDVAMAHLALNAHVQSQKSIEAGGEIEALLAQQPAWEINQAADRAEALIAATLDLSTLHLTDGDVVLVSGLARDGYELDGRGHDVVRSPVRRLRVMSEVEFATQLRRQLSAVRQNAIRIEAMQAELQDDVAEDSVRPGMSRAQAQIGERIASQREAVEDIERLMLENRLNDPQLAEILQQTHDLLNAAGQAANRAVQEIEKRANAQPSKAQRDDASPPKPLAPGSARDQQPNAPSDSNRDQSSATGSDGQSGEQQPNTGNSQPDQQQPQQPQPAPSESPDAQPRAQRDPQAEADHADRPLIDAQQEVRNELTDLITLLDRDEDTWVVRRQIENLLQEQAELEALTRQLGERTLGQKPEDLPEALRSEIEKAAQRQRELPAKSRKLAQELRERAKSLQNVDPQSAQGMQQAADIADAEQPDQDMDQAARNIEQNQMTTAGARQQSAQSKLKKMLQAMEESKRAKAQQLIRQLASLIESIQRLIVVQENELNSLALAKDTGNLSGLDRQMIRLNQNTQAVAGEARAAGQEARRIARSLDRAADAQGAAVSALRANPVLADDAEEAENRSLELLKQAKALAEELQQQTQDEETARRREEIMEAYRKFAERQVALREQTLELAGLEQLNRRQLVEARRLGNAQDEIRTGLNELRDITAEILDSLIFTHVHGQIDVWSATASDLLIAGTVNVDVTDRQQQIADSIGRLIEALEEANAPPPEFAENQNNSGGQGGQQGQPPLIPPVAQLKLLQGMQKQVYNLTKELDTRTDLDDAQRRTRLRELGQQQRDLMDIGERMIEALRGQMQGAPPPTGGSDSSPEPSPTPPTPPEPEPGAEQDEHEVLQ